MLKFFFNLETRASGIQLSPKYGNVRMRDIMYVRTYKGPATPSFSMLRTSRTLKTGSDVSVALFAGARPVECRVESL